MRRTQQLGVERFKLGKQQIGINPPPPACCLFALGRDSQLTEEVIFDMYDLEKVETLKYLDLSKSKWRSVEARTKETL